MIAVAVAVAVGVAVGFVIRGEVDLWRRSNGQRRPTGETLDFTRKRVGL